MEKSDDEADSSDHEPLPPAPQAPRHHTQPEATSPQENDETEEGEYIEDSSIDKQRFKGVSVIGEYQIQKRIGEGTFGEVSIAIHRSTGDVCALKKILVHNEKEGVYSSNVRCP
jgi:serine/threonine protein kinase